VLANSAPGEGLLCGLQTITFLVFLHMADQASFLLSLIRTLTLLDQGSNLMTYFTLITPLLQIVPLEVRSSTYELRGGHNSTHTTSYELVLVFHCGLSSSHFSDTQNPKSCSREDFMILPFAGWGFGVSAALHTTLLMELEPSKLEAQKVKVISQPNRHTQCSPLEWQPQEGCDICLLCLLKNPQNPEQCLAYSWHSINVAG
jgi:hypothetical protein